MRDLDRLDQLPPIFRAIAERAATCTVELVAAPLLDLTRRYLVLRDERPDLAPAVRFDRIFGPVGDPDAMARGVAAWATMIEELLALTADGIAGVAAAVPGDDHPHRTHTALVFAVEAQTRDFAVPEDDRVARLACGELALEDAIRSLGPKAGAPKPAGKRAPAPRRPLAAIFGELGGRARDAGVALRVAPLLASAARYAAAAGQPEAARVTAALGEDHPLGAEFPRWFALASELVGDLDDVAEIADAPHLRARNLDVLLYMLERSIGDDAGGDLEETTDAILDGRLSLAEAVAPSL